MWWLVRFGGASKGSEEGSRGGGGKVVKLRLNPELSMVHVAPQSSNPLSADVLLQRRGDAAGFQVPLTWP